MTGYIMNFTIYTLAMIGVIFAALFVFKGVTSSKGFGKKSSFLNVEETMSLSPRKTLYVVTAGSQKFLLASDIDKTSLIAELKPSLNQGKTFEPVKEDTNFDLDKLYTDTEPLGDFSSIIEFQKERRSQNNKGPMMKELARKLSSI